MRKGVCLPGGPGIIARAKVRKTSAIWVKAIADDYAAGMRFTDIMYKYKTSPDRIIRCALVHGVPLRNRDRS